MDRIEAIDILVGVIATNSEEENEALDLAIEALQEKHQLSRETSTNTPTCNQKQVTSKLKNPHDSLLKADSDECKEQKSKLDCISRQQAIDEVKKMEMDKISIVGFWELIESLPPVTPTERTGEWIVYPLKDEGRVELECSECGNTVIGAISYKPNFCENCGAIMESEKLAMQRR